MIDTPPERVKAATLQKKPVSQPMADLIVDGLKAAGGGGQFERREREADQMVEAIGNILVEHEAYVTLEAVRAVGENRENDVLKLLGDLQVLKSLNNFIALVRPKIEEADRCGVTIPPTPRAEFEQVVREAEALRASVEARQQDPALKPVFEAREEVKRKVGSIVVLEETAKLEVDGANSTLQDSFKQALVVLSPQSRARLADYFGKKSTDAKPEENEGENAQMEAKIQSLKAAAEVLNSDEVNFNFTGSDLVARAVCYFLEALNSGDYLGAAKNLDTVYEKVTADALQKYTAGALKEAQLLRDFDLYNAKPVPPKNGWAGVLGPKTDEFKAWVAEGTRIHGNIANSGKTQWTIKSASNLARYYQPTDKDNFMAIRPYMEKCIEVYEKLAEACSLLGVAGGAENTKFQQYLDTKKYAQVAHTLSDGWTKFAEGYFDAKTRGSVKPKRG